MNKKHESDTIKQQRKAREEFLKLKKIQSGELPPDSYPNDTPIVPKTLGEKAENIRYHYGKIIIVGIFIFIALVIMVVQCCQRTNYDLQIIYFSYTPVMDSVTNDMASYFEKICDDVNNDGEKHIAVLNCSVNKNSNNNTALTKMQAVIASESNALLFITDDDSIKYFDKLRTDDFTFFKDSVALGNDFYSSSEFSTALPENLKLNIRNVTGTQLEKDKNLKKFYKASEKIFNSQK